ncbi:anti-sigma-I factor RsgI2-like [Penaeus vannamei]|uniref:anti-sigma-I factor RsgI2-like n=1 Tax=Penaeus vannamei TaxID=6689 RepID=UPI00387F74BC
MQWQYSVTLFLPEASVNPTSILPRLASIDKTSPMIISTRSLSMSEMLAFGHPNIGAPQPAAFHVPNLVITVQIARLSHVHVPIVETPILYFIEAALPISLNVPLSYTLNLRPTSTHPIQQSNPFSILNPDTPISTTSLIPTPPYFRCHTSSPPEILKNIQNFLKMTLMNTPPSSTLNPTVPIPTTFEVYADIYPPPPQIPSYRFSTRTNPLYHKCPSPDTSPPDILPVPTFPIESPDTTPSPTPDPLS